MYSPEVINKIPARNFLLKTLLLISLILFRLVLIDAQNEPITHFPSLQKADYDTHQSDLLFQQLESEFMWVGEAMPNVVVDSTDAWRVLAKSRNQFGLRNYQRAFKLADSALLMANESGDRELQMRCFGTIGDISRDVFLGHSLKAVPHHEKALAISKELKDSVYISRQLLALADNYLQAGRYDRFLEYLEKAAFILNSVGAPVSQVRARILFGTFLSETKDYERSEEMFRSAMKIATQIGREDYVQHLYIQLCDVNLQEKKPEKANMYLDSALVRGLVLDEYDLNEKLYGIEKVRGNREKAFEYLEKAYSGVGESYLKRSAEQIAGMEANLRTREQLSELKNKDHLLRSKETTRLLLLSMVILISLLLAYISYAFYRQKQDKKVLAEQLEVISIQADELKKAEAQKSRFFVNVAHELRTPITLILGPISNVLNSNGIGNRQKELLKIALQNCYNLMNRIGDILKLSKLESGKMERQKRKVPLQSFLKDLVTQFQSKAKMGEVDLSVSSLPKRAVHVHTDPVHLNTILTNLLNNAIKFTPPGGSVSLSAEENGDTVKFKVADTGAGISREDLPKIFDRYFQTNQVNAPMEGGAGIGLALSRELATLLGGKIWASSVPGKGSSFYVEIPVSPLWENETETDAVDLHDLNSEGSKEIKLEGVPLGFRKGPRVMVVEDDPGVLDFINYILSIKYQVVTASNGKNALQLLENEHGTNPVKIIISDIMMPQMDGYHLLETLKSDDRWKNIPVIMLTARAGKQDRLKALRIGVDDYLLKPFEEDELLARIENLLKNQEARTSLQETAPVTKQKQTLASDDIDEKQLQWLETVESVVHEQITDSNFTLDSLSETMGLSRRQFQRRLKSATGLTATEYLLELRLQKARELMEQEEAMTIRELAASVGFRDVKYFSKAFKVRFGISPSKYTTPDN